MFCPSWAPQQFIYVISSFILIITQAFDFERSTCEKKKKTFCENQKKKENIFVETTEWVFRRNLGTWSCPTERVSSLLLPQKTGKFWGLNNALLVRYSLFFFIIIIRFRIFFFLFFKSRVNGTCILLVFLWLIGSVWFKILIIYPCFILLNRLVRGYAGGLRIISTGGFCMRIFCLKYWRFGVKGFVLN